MSHMWAEQMCPRWCRSSRRAQSSRLPGAIEEVIGAVGNEHKRPELSRIRAAGCGRRDTTLRVDAMNVGRARQQRSASRTVFTSSDLEERLHGMAPERRNWRPKTPARRGAPTQCCCQASAARSGARGLAHRDLRSGNASRPAAGTTASTRSPAVRTISRRPGGRRHADVVLRSVGTRLQVGNIAMRHRQGRRHVGHLNVAVLRVHHR